MSRDALELSPEEILAKHCIPERHARAIVSVYFTETWPRMEQVLDVRGLRGSHSRLRPGKAWKHAVAFNRLVRIVCTADSATAVSAAAQDAPAVLVRRLGGVSSAFGWLGHQEFDAAALRLDDLTDTETAAARAAIADLLSVGGDGTLLGQEPDMWFADWSEAMYRTAGQFLSHARLFRSLSSTL